MTDWADRDQLVDWGQYFESIVSVCPWSKAYWQAQRIDVLKWQGEDSVMPLGNYVARVWIYQGAYTNTLVNISNNMNSLRKHEEWLYSHPVDKNNSTPVPILIQQCKHILTEARTKNKLPAYAHLKQEQ